MSKAPSLTDTDDVPDRDDPEELIEENRELFERIADADLPISDRLQAALDYVDAERDGS